VQKAEGPLYESARAALTKDTDRVVLTTEIYLLTVLQGGSSKIEVSAWLVP
jgi:hypothetical protein